MRYSLFVIRPHRRGDGGHVLSGAEGFTLMELIITIAILAILLVGVVLVLNPVERIAEANDSKRQQDLSAISDAIEFTQASGREKEFGGLDPDGALTDRCVGESNQTIFVSIVGTDAMGTCASPPNDLPSGWTYRCAPNDGPGDVDGTGWIPADMTGGGSVSSPLSNFPRDSESTFSTGYYYTYVCDRSGDFELTARMVSDKFRTGGERDIQSTDGGDDIFVYETGTDLSLDPKAPVGYWPLDELSGAVARDSTGHGNDGTYDENLALLTYGAAGVRGTAIELARDVVTTNGPRVSLGTVLNDPVHWTFAVWWYPFVDTPAINAGLIGEDNTPRLTQDDRSRIFETGVEFEAGGWAGFVDWNFSAINEWQYAVATWEDANTMTPENKIYGNGQLIETKSDFGAALDDPDTPIFLNSRDGHEISEGRMDEAAVYDRALDVAEIAYQYESLKP